MFLVFLIISAFFVGSSWGQLGDQIVDKCKNETRIHCGINKFCVPVHLCREDKSNVNGEPSLDPSKKFDVCGPTSRCCHFDNQKNKTRKFGFDVPYLGSFPPKTFGVGKSIRVEGHILPQLPTAEFNQSFLVRLQSGRDFWPKPTIAFEISDYTTGEESQPKELHKNLAREENFILDIVRGQTSYKVYVNKELVVEIPMKVDEKPMDTLYMNGDFHLRDVVIENFSPNTEPEKPPYVFKDLGVIKEGVSFIVTGYLLPDWEGFEINLMTDDDSIALHVNPRQKFGVIAFNTLVNTSWSDPGHLDYKLPSSLREGSTFACQILVTEKSYMIAINGRHVYEFQHRLPYASVSYIEAVGGIDNVDLKRTEVSQYPERLRESDVEKIWVTTD